MIFFAVFSFLFFLSGGIFKVFFPDVLFFHGQRLTLYVSFFVLLSAMLTEKGRFLIVEKSKNLKNKKWWIIPLFVLSQAIAIYQSSFLGCNFIGQFFAVLVLLLSIMIHAMAVFLILELGFLYLFGLAWLCLFVMDVLIIGLQIGYQLFPDVFLDVIGLFSHTLEARWNPELLTESVHRFYQEGGSYVRTTFRLSGLAEEAPTHAIFIAVVFLPLAMSAALTNYMFWRSDNKISAIDRCILAITLFLIGFILIASSSSTAIIYFLLSVVMVFLFLVVFRGQINKFFKIYFSVFLLGAGLGFYYLDFVKDISAQRVLEAQQNQVKDISAQRVLEVQQNQVKDITGRGSAFYLNKMKDMNNASTNSRLAMTVTEINIMVNHLPLGVGRGCSSFYTATYLPKWTEDNFEIKMWREAGGKYPVLNQWTNICAEYGLWGVALICGLAVLIFKSFVVLCQVRTLDAKTTFWQCVCFLFFIFYFVGMLTSLYWRQSIYIQMIFVLLWVRQQHTEKKYGG